jgi:hypothetical protein
MTQPAAEDPNLEEAIDLALAQFSGLIPPSRVEEMRRSLRFGLAAHPGAQALLHRLGARPHVKRSGKVCSAEIVGEDTSDTRTPSGNRPR